MTPMQQLLYRNAELETELRLVNLQLQEAHTTTRHLLRHFSSQAPTNVSVEHAQLQSQLDGALKEINLLKNRMTGTGVDHKNAFSSVNRVDRSLKATDLIEFEDNDAGEAPIHGPTAATHHAHDSKTVKASGEEMRHFGQIWASRRSGETEDAEVCLYPRSTRHGEFDGEDDEMIMRPSASPRLIGDDAFQGRDSFVSSATGTHQSSPKATNSFYFSPLARNALVANAAFLEDQDKDERMDTFFNLSKRFPEHVPFEFKWLYESEVRPSFQANQKAADAWRQRSRTESPQDSYTAIYETQAHRITLAGCSEAPRMANMEDETSIGRPARSTEEDVETCGSDTQALNQLGRSQAGLQNTRVGLLNDSGDSSVDEKDPALLCDAKPKGSAVRTTYAFPETPVEQAKAPIYSTSPSSLERADARSRRSHLFVHESPQQDRHFSSRGTRNDWWTGPQEVQQLFFAQNSSASKLRRTIVITNVTAGISLSQIVDRVHGGPILSATFLDTCDFRTKPSMGWTNGAMIVFAFSGSAEKFFNDCRGGNWLLFRHKLLGSNIKARIELIDTPTRPAPVGLLQALKERKVSRVLYVNDGHKWQPDEAASEIVRYSNNSGSYDKVPQPLKAIRDSDGIIVLEYASVFHAQRARLAVERNHWFFKNVQCGFLADPCDQLESRCKNTSEAEVAAKVETARDGGRIRLRAVLVEQEREDKSDTSSGSIQDASLVNEDSMPRAVATEVLRTGDVSTTGLEQLAALVEV